jgi:hypothetical protein
MTTPTGVPVLAFTTHSPPTHTLLNRNMCACVAQVTLLDASPDPGGLSATSTSASGQVIEPGIKGEEGRGGAAFACIASGQLTNRL